MAEKQEAAAVVEQTEEEEPDDGVPKVLVTGASGYIAQHVIKQLLETGRYRVRGSVRNKNNEEKVKPLLELVPDAKYPLRLMEAELQDKENWVKAVKGCTYVLHIASPVKIQTPRDEQEMIRPAVEGTTNVLQACADAGTVKRVVVTSSVAAVSSGIMGNPGNPPDYVYTDKDWSEEAICSPYEKSKLKAEQAAWEFVKSLSEDKKFELVVINPVVVQGPFLTKIGGEASREFMKMLLTGGLPFIPDFSIGLVDVHDVAAAHIAGMEKPEAAGKRYILWTETLHLREICQIVREEFQPQGYNKIPTMNLVIPRIVLWALKFFITPIKQYYDYIGKHNLYNNEPMIQELGVKPRPVSETITDTCYSVIELGFVNKTPGYLGHPSTRPPPEKPAEAKPEESKPEETKPEEPVKSTAD